MERDFTVERIALHRMDKAADPEIIQKATQEVDLAAFTEQADKDAIRSFFNDHLNRIWDAPEGSNRVAAARFTKESAIREDYNVLSGDSRQFLERSQRMADSLFQVAPKNSSPGILMALWVRANQDQRKFLALFKMDPKRSDKISLRLHGNQVLLDLAVQHIDQALPDTADRVLKWAITPHPTRPFDVKIKDNQSTAEPAIYFMKFLGCEERPSEKQQTINLLEGLSYTAIDKLTKEIGTLPTVDLKVIRQSSALTDSQKEKIESSLPTDFSISSKVIQRARLGYKLSNKIVIKGPWAAMKSVRIQRLSKNNIEFCIRATDYEEFYE